MVEKNFNYLPLPPEIRSLIVDKMLPDDRCRFSGCSNTCNIEAKNSKNYMNALHLLVYDFCATIFIAHNHYDNNNDYSINFIKTSEGNKMRCRNGRKELWEIEIENSANLKEYAIQYFKALLERHQRGVKVLSIGGEFENLDFKIDRLDNLEEMKLIGDINYQNLLSKTRRPLKSLEINDAKINRECEQLYQVQYYLSWHELKLNNEQFQCLSASRVCIHIGDLTENDIFNFIESWQYGRIWRKIEDYGWNLEGSLFDVQKLLILLGVPEHNLIDDDLELKHHSENRRIAKMRYFVDDARKIMFREEI